MAGFLNAFANPGAALTTNNRLTQLLQSQPDPNNGTMYGGLAHVLQQGLLGYLQGSDARASQQAQQAYAKGLQPDKPADGVGPTAPGGIQGAINALNPLAQSGNEYAGRLSADLLQQQQALQQKQAELQAQRDFQSKLLSTKLQAQANQNQANHEFTAGQNALNRQTELVGKTLSPTPTQLQLYQSAKAAGYPGSLLDFITAQKKAGATHITNSVSTAGNSFNKELGKQNADEFIKQRGSAQEAVSSLQNNQQARHLLDQGVITGFGANFELGMGKALQQAGIHLADQPIANTEAYAALRAQEVGRVIKQFGSGTGLSDADRQYAQKMAAGEITLNEASLRKILDISDRANRNIIDRYNKQASMVDPRLSPFPLTVEIPSGLDQGQSSAAQRVDTIPPGPPPPNPYAQQPITRVIGGKTYVNHNGQWYEQ